MAEPMTPDDIATAFKLSREGWGVKRIGKRLHRGHDTISVILGKGFTPNDEPTEGVTRWYGPIRVVWTPDEYRRLSSVLEGTVCLR